jgi:hypothetical protein
MGFDNAVDKLDLSLLQLGWQAEGNKLVLRGLPKSSVQTLIKKPGVSERIALLLRRVGLDVAQICCPGKVNGYRVFASMAPEEPIPIPRRETMESTSNLASSIQVPDRFVWFGGIITPDQKLQMDAVIDRMQNSDEPMGLVQPILNSNGGVIRTIQWGINKASVDLFNFNALSMEDMKAAIQRDTSGDWHPEDLEQKRQLYAQGKTRFEQAARIRTKAGWMLVHFQCERTGVGDLVLSRGKQESDVVERPELLVTV